MHALVSATINNPEATGFEECVVSVALALNHPALGTHIFFDALSHSVIQSLLRKRAKL